GRLTRWRVFPRENEIEQLENGERARGGLMSGDQSVRRIIDGMPGLISTATAEGATEFVNRQMLEYFGKTLDTLNGWEVFEAVHPEDRSQTMAAWRYSLETAQPYEVECRLCDPNRTYRWFRICGLPARDAEDRIIRWNLLLTDIEDRKQFQHERDRIRFLLDLSNRVSSDLELRQVFQAISSEIRRIFQCDFVGLARPDSTEKHMRQHMVDFPESKGLMKEGALYPMEGSLSGAVFRSGKPLVLNSLAEGNSIWMADRTFYQRITEEGP